jgi:ribosomal-protein-alanine N-acetyltransferase
MDIRVENASTQHLDELYEIEKQCFKVEAFSKEQIWYLLIDKNCVNFAAWLEGKLAGFVVGMIEFEENQSVGHVITLDVAPRFWRKGVAQRLLFELESTLMKRDIKECYLEVKEDNTSALNLYTKLGYCRVHKLENFYPTVHGYYLRKKL